MTSKFAFNKDDSIVQAVSQYLKANGKDPDVVDHAFSDPLFFKKMEKHMGGAATDAIKSLETSFGLRPIEINSVGDLLNRFNELAEKLIMNQMDPPSSSIDSSHDNRSYPRGLNHVTTPCGDDEY